MEQLHFEAIDAFSSGGLGFFRPSGQLSITLAPHLIFSSRLLHHKSEKLCMIGRWLKKKDFMAAVDETVTINFQKVSKPLPPVYNKKAR